MRLRPFGRHGEPRTAIQGSRIPAERLPLLRGFGQPPVDESSLTVLVEPGAQRRPVADERLVSDLHRALIDRHQPSLDQQTQHLLDVTSPLGSGRELADTNASAGVLRPLAELGQAQKDVARQRLLLERERLLVHRLRGLRDGPADATRLHVAEEGEHPIAAPPPGLEEAVREQRQGAWLADDVAQDAFRQAGLENEPGLLGRPFDRPPQLLLRHGADQRLVIL